MRFQKFIFVATMLLLSVSISFAQSLENACAKIVDNSFSDMGINCAGMEANTACIGSAGVSAGFANDATVQFKNPADRVSLLDVTQINSSDINLRSEEYGLSVINTYANLPAAAPGEGVVLIGMGDVQIIEATAPENLFIPVPLDVTVQADSESASLLSYPPQWGTTESEEVGVVENGYELSVDAITEDGQWLRAYYLSNHAEVDLRASAWIHVDNITDVDLSILPAINPDSRTPMQNIAVITGDADPACAEQPVSELFIQGPSPVEVQLTINGVDIGITSSAKFKMHKKDNKDYGRFTSVTGSLKIYNPKKHGHHGQSIIIKPGEIFDFPCIIDAIKEYFHKDHDWFDNFDSHKRNHDSKSRNGGHYGDFGVFDLFKLLKKIPNNILWYAIKECLPEYEKPSGVGQPKPKPHHNSCKRGNDYPYHRR